MFFHDSRQLITPALFRPRPNLLSSFHLSACAWTLCMLFLLIFLRWRAQGCFSLFFFRYNTFITYILAACAFITRDQPLSSPRQLSAQARSQSQIQGTSITYFSSAGGRSRLPFEDVFQLTINRQANSCMTRKH